MDKEQVVAALNVAMRALHNEGKQYERKILRALAERIERARTYSMGTPLRDYLEVDWSDEGSE